MPEATMHEDSRFVFRKCQIRPARQVPAVKSKPEAQGMSELPDYPLGLSILPLN
jgi:hypothetical protein